MKPRDIVTLAMLSLGLAGMAAIGAVAYWLDNAKFRERVRNFATQFPDRMERLRHDLIEEEMMPETTPQQEPPSWQT
jgi:hypothetical protein